VARPAAGRGQPGVAPLPAELVDQQARRVSVQPCRRRRRRVAQRLRYQPGVEALHVQRVIRGLEQQLRQQLRRAPHQQPVARPIHAAAGKLQSSPL